MVRASIGNADRKVTWVELFFDLVFVAAAHEVATILQKTTGLGDAVTPIMLFMVILWVWLGHTLFTSRFESHNVLYYLFTLITMIAVFAMVVQFKGATNIYMIGFAYAYAATRFALVIMYIFALVKYPSRALFLFPMLVTLSVSGIFWGLSPHTPYPLILWVVGFFIDFITPVFSKNLLDRVAVHTTHLPERFGILTVIMLGEMIISLVASSHAVALNVEVMTALMTGLITITVIFWLYFKFVERDIISADESASVLFIYAHIPLFLGLVALAAGYKGVIAGYSTEWLVLSGIILFVLSFRAIKIVRDLRFQRRQIIALFMFAPFLIVYAFASGQTLLYTIILSFVFVTYLIISDGIMPMFGSRQQPSRRNQLEW